MNVMHGLERNESGWHEVKKKKRSGKEGEGEGGGGGGEEEGKETQDKAEVIRELTRN